MTRRTLRIALLALLALPALGQRAQAQHTLGVTAGYGMGLGRITPSVESRSRWGMYSGGLSWRYYGRQRVAGGFGVDLEFVQQGFSYAPNASLVDEREEYLWYTRHLNTLMLPIVWQPHFYMVRNHVRVYLEAAATFSYALSSRYENEFARENGLLVWQGDYAFKTPRDNRFGYGLAGGGGVALLFGQFEVQLRARYYFGFSDVVRNRNRYADNADDGAENPFYATPMRSPLDNLTLSVGFSYRFNKEGFETWKPRVKREKSRTEFKYGF